jgi:anthranilate synthase component 1
VDDTFTITLAGDQVTPVRAYAALRSFAPRQTSYLFESLTPNAVGGRFSIVGYRARSESLYPAGGDALAMLVQELGAPDGPSSGEIRPPAEALARRLARAFVGYISYDAVHPMLGIKPWESEGPMARLIQGSTVVVFDHHTNLCTIAGPTQASINRCTWEMSHGPDLRPLRAPSAEATPEHVDVSMNDETFIARVTRAQEKLATGEVTELSLARTFRTPPRNADPFDIYRALRLLSPQPYLFFCDFVETPMVPSQIVLGASSHALASDEPAELSSGERLRRCFPAKSRTGAPRDKAARLIRELEVEPRGLHGGVVGYVLPDGELGLCVAERSVVLEHAYLQVTAGVTIGRDTDPRAAAEETRTEASLGLAAVRAAQDAADAREAIDAHKRAKEEAAKARAAEPPPESAGDEGDSGSPEAKDERASE